MKKITPSFKATFIGIGITYVLLSLSLFAKGLIKTMGEFKVPEKVLNSPHYFDAMKWVYIHMIFIGILIAIIGYSVSDFNKQKWITLILFFSTCYYTYLDFSTSDSPLGNGLYQGKSSVMPALIGLVINLILLQLAVRMFINWNNKK